MDYFSKLMGEALENGETIESALRSAVAKAAQEIIDSFMESEITAHLGYERYDHKAGDNSGDSRNGKTQRTVMTSMGPITVNVPRDRNGTFKSAAVQPYKRKTEVISSTILKLYSAGLTDDEMRLIIESLYDASVSRSYVSSVTDAVMDDVRRFNEMPMPAKAFCLYLDSTYVPPEARHSPKGGHKHSHGDRLGRAEGDTRVFDNAGGVRGGLRRSAGIVQIQGSEGRRRHRVRRHTGDRRSDRRGVSESQKAALLRPSDEEPLLKGAKPRQGGDIG